MRLFLSSIMALGGALAYYPRATGSFRLNAADETDKFEEKGLLGSDEVVLWLLATGPAAKVAFSFASFCCYALF